MRDIMWSFETANLLVQAYIEPSEDLDLSWDEDGETLEGLESGRYVAFDTFVKVTHKGTGAELGGDTLCQSIYENPSDFFQEHIGLAAKSRADGRKYGAYFPDMIGEAITEARKSLRALKSIHIRA